MDRASFQARLIRPLRILAVADEVDDSLYGERTPALRPELVLACGDLPADYLEYLVSRLDVPLLYVPGNHDPDLAPPDRTWAPLEATPKPEPGPQGCVNIDGRAVDVAGMRVAGLGGSPRYRPGPNQYSQAQMTRRALKLDVRLRLNTVRSGRKLDILVTHAAPFGIAPAGDAAHAGFHAFARLIRSFHPLLAVHGHVHPYGREAVEAKLGATRVVNVVPSRLIDL